MVQDLIDAIEIWLVSEKEFGGGLQVNLPKGGV
jgi:hypothetical protein